MLGLGLGWEITWMLLEDGRVAMRTTFAQQLRGEAADRAMGQLSASYEDKFVPWDQVPPEVQRGFAAQRKRILKRLQDASAKGGGT